MNNRLKPYFTRFLLTGITALIFVSLINEGAHYLLKDRNNRPPQIVQLTIPHGTAARVAAGETPPSIPMEMTFVIGDTLQVHNLDEVPHELGPLFIPAGTKASLLMEDANKYTLGCTFQSSKYLDFNVRSRTTAYDRIQALGLATPPTIMFLFAYSLLVFPIKTEKSESKQLD